MLLCLLIAQLSLITCLRKHAHLIRNPRIAKDTPRRYVLDHNSAAFADLRWILLVQSVLIQVGWASSEIIGFGRVSTSGTVKSQSRSSQEESECTVFGREVYLPSIFVQDSITDLLDVVFVRGTRVRTIYLCVALIDFTLSSGSPTGFYNQSTQQLRSSSTHGSGLTPRFMDLASEDFVACRRKQADGSGVRHFEASHLAAFFRQSRRISGFKQRPTAWVACLDASLPLDLTLIRTVRSS